MDGWRTAREVLGGPAGPLRDAVRWGLEGLRGCLTAADDPAAPRLLAELEELLAGRPAAGLAPTPGGLLLGALADAAEADPRLQAEAGPLSLPRTDDVSIWTDLHWHLLRAAEETACEWRAKAAGAADSAGARLVPATGTGPPLSPDEEFVPGLAGAITVGGVRGTSGRPGADPMAVLLNAAAVSGWFAESGTPGLRHALRNVRRFEVGSLAQGQGAAYRAEVERRRGVLLAEVGNPGAGLLRALLDLDEAVQSLLPWPPPAPNSWWGRWRRLAREAVREARRAVPVSCQIRPLAGRFAEVHHLTADSLPVEVGTPGEVVVCLRQYATVGGEELLGRVLYRPQE
jgi:hypothetical protein